ncbi:Uncharacterised protein [Klebsiella quasipneumoniae]|nr:Uncharacterised protein [Klebsiella quasipneumoniae]
MLEFRKVKAAVLQHLRLSLRIYWINSQGNYEHEPTEFQ